VKKRAVGKSRESSVVPATIAAAQNRKLSAAIENVFRLTHGREMTAEERRLFGLSQHTIDENGRSNSRGSHSGPVGRNSK
jgi:hypothetical protein